MAVYTLFYLALQPRNFDCAPLSALYAQFIDFKLYSRTAPFMRVWWAFLGNVYTLYKNLQVLFYAEATLRVIFEMTF